MKRKKMAAVALAVALVLSVALGAHGAIAARRQAAAGKATAIAPGGGTTAPAATTSAAVTAEPATAPAGSGTAVAVAPAESVRQAKPVSAAATSTVSTRRAEPVSRGERKPLSGRVIFIDPGHGSPGSGANGANGGDEAANNLATALILRDLLTGAGARVVMSRTTMIDPRIPGVTDDQLEARTMMANASGAEIFISLHENYSEEYPGARGLTVYYRNDAMSRRLAGKIEAATSAATGWSSFGTEAASYYVLRNSRLKAAVLVECGFLSNAEDERLLGTDAFRRRIAAGVFNGIVAYFQ